MVKILSNDPSLRNWGYVEANYNNGLITIMKTGVIETKPNKVLKQNIQDMQTANVLYTQLKPMVINADLVIAELPHGSQSSRAMVSYAVCVSVLGTLLNHNPNFIPVSFAEVKKMIGILKPQKQDVINWVQDKYPDLVLPNKSKAEHICDAITALHVAINKPQFTEYL
ncbi:hypothetical protein MOMA_06951 [Moraxella macacae 0408225]|uniref:Uncharacterized protein n=1 Tax=Moraxella macacae 0408225 TaxID=1230338 RepID=L2F5V5_9GAMM|nr:hypothetical protein [Moraxella macacae]ELA08280.1 hypothetical protein MOMA_06951 [Moraxella macacae 0408225]